MNESTEEVDIILIWGTFAVDAPWVQENSFFRNSLKRNLVDRGLRARFEVFSWSAENSHIARNRAAEALAKLIDEKKELNRKIVLVGHSHGGTVSYMGSNTARLWDTKTDKVITLGTPFFHVGKNYYQTLIILMMMVLVLYAGMGYLVKTLFHSDLTSNESTAALNLGINFYDKLQLFFTEAWHYPLFAILIGSAIFVFAEFQVKRKGEKLGFNKLERKNKVYALSIRGDEARLLLIVWSILAASVNLSMLYLLFTFLCFPFLITEAQFHPFLLYFSDGVGRTELIELSIFLIFAHAFPWVLVLAILSFAISKIRGTWIAYGDEPFLFNIVRNITVSTTPNLESKKIVFVRLTSVLSGSLRHSVFYDDERISEKVSEILSGNISGHSPFIYVLEVIVPKLVFIVAAYFFSDAAIFKFRYLDYEYPDK